MATKSDHLSHDAAMALRVIGTDRTVADVHGSVFRELLFAVVARHPAHYAIMQDLGALHLRYTYDRVQALRTLEHYGVPLDRMVSAAKPVDSQADEEVLKSLWVQPAQPE